MSIMNLGKLPHDPAFAAAPSAAYNHSGVVSIALFRLCCVVFSQITSNFLTGNFGSACYPSERPFAADRRDGNDSGSLPPAVSICR